MTKPIAQLIPDLPQPVDGDDQAGAVRDGGASPTDLPRRHGRSSGAMVPRMRLSGLMALEEAANRDASAMLAWTPAQIGAIRAAAAPLRPLPMATPEDIAKAVLAMMEMLPRKTSDDDGGQLKMKLCIRMLRGTSADALKWLTERVIAECDWFPTIKTMKAMLREWERRDEPAQAKALAARMLNRRRMAVQRAQDAQLDLIRLGRVTPDELAGMPEAVKARAVEHGWLIERDGGHVLRGGFGGRDGGVAGAEGGAA